MSKHEKAYSEILKVLNKYKDICIYDVDDLEYKAERHLLGLKLKDEYGLDIDPKAIRNLDWIELKHYCIISWYGGKYSRKVSWSDDGSQPEDEMLLYISFPTGAYIFGEHYPEELFKEFFLELKSYKPKYTDTRNSSLYFSMDNAKDVFNSFNNILNKYYKKDKDMVNERRITELKKELSKLENKEQS